MDSRDAGTREAREGGLPETLLQFGAGRFLRAFVDLFVHHANLEGQGVGRVVVVQSTPGDRARLLNAQAGRYHVLLRGVQDGRLIDQTEEVVSISRALVASEQWEAVLEAARSPHLRAVLSNTTEAGLALDPADTPEHRPPRSYPARLLRVLEARYQAGGSGLLLLPCELVEGNGDRLRGLVLEQAERWSLPLAFRDWVREACFWPNSLVDRIVVGRPADHPLLSKDALLTLAEPYALWALEERPGMPPFLRHPALRRTTDVRPFFLRKVRILNGAHTALVARALPRGFRTVREAVLDPEVGGWLRRLLFEEIVPTIDDRVEDAEGFARQVLERFSNPFLEHKLSDIALYHEAKVAIRLAPTREEYLARFGHAPRLLEEVVSG